MKRLSITIILGIGFVLGFISNAEARLRPGQMGGILRNSAKLYKQAKDFAKKYSDHLAGTVITFPRQGAILKGNVRIKAEFYYFPPGSVDDVKFYASDHFIGQSSLSPIIVSPDYQIPSGFSGVASIFLGYNQNSRWLA